MMRYMARRWAAVALFCLFFFGVALADSPISFETAEDLNDARVRIGVELGTLQDNYLTNNLPKAQLMRFPSFSDTVAALQSGNIDACMAPRTKLKPVAKRDERFVLFGGDIIGVDAGLGFPKGSALRQPFDAFFAELKQSGEWDKMYAYYYEADGDQTPAIESSGENGALRVGVNGAAGLPFCAREGDGRYIGLDVELVMRFAASMGKRIVIEDYSFSGLLAAVTTAKVDLILGGVGITEERRQKIDYSEPLYQSISTFIVRRDLVAGESAIVPDVSARKAGFWAGLRDQFYNNLIRDNRYLLILNGLKNTLIIALLSLLLGTLIGALVCAMRMSKRAALARFAAFYISLLRGVPVLVVLMLVFYVVFARVQVPPIAAAMVAFGMNFGAYAAEVFRSGIEQVDRGQTEAALASGFTASQAFRHIVLPQALTSILPIYQGEFIKLVQLTSVVGYIAVEDLTKAGDIIRSRTFEAFFPLIIVAALYFALTWLLSLLLSALGRNLRRRRASA